MKKLTIEQVRAEFAEKGRELLDTEYGGLFCSMSYRCKCGNVGKASLLATRKSKSGCYKCNDCVESRRYSFDEAAEILKKHGCELISSFNSIRDKVEYMCKCGVKSEGIIGHLLSGQHCRSCGNNKTKHALRMSPNEISLFCKKNDLEFISVDYNQNKPSGANYTIVEYKCKCGKIAKAHLDNLKKHPNCWQCGNAKKSGNKCHMWNPDREQVAKNKLIQRRSYTMVRRVLNRFDKEKKHTKSNYLGYSAKELHDRIYLEHPDFDFSQDWHIDHIFPVQAFLDHGIENMSIINHLTNLRPLKKNDNIKKGEDYDVNCFNTWLENIKKNQLNKTESCEWFLSEVKRMNLSVNVLNKNNCCNIGDCPGPVSFFEYELDTRAKQCLGFLKAFNKIFNRNLHGRKCNVKQVSKDIAFKFFNDYHIQGSNKLLIVAFGLFHKDELVGVLSLGRHNRHSEKNQIVLDRLCFKDGVHIHGGASKLLARAVEWARVQKYEKIISFSDNRWTSGNVYKSTGFILEAEHGPDYRYLCPDGRIVSKQSQKKSSSKCPDGLTEREWAEARGMIRLWDAGKKRWSYCL